MCKAYCVTLCKLFGPRLFNEAYNVCITNLMFRKCQCFLLVFNCLLIVHAIKRLHAQRQCIPDQWIWLVHMKSGTFPQWHIIFNIIPNLTATYVPYCAGYCLFHLQYNANGPYRYHLFASVTRWISTSHVTAFARIREQNHKYWTENARTLTCESVLFWVYNAK